jgi:hypothetical protein
MKLLLFNPQLSEDFANGKYEFFISLQYSIELLQAGEGPAKLYLATQFDNDGELLGEYDYQDGFEARADIEALQEYTDKLFIEY